tara:strand:+ start:108 stop:443 length:336 start_codon:yes stop_codon:yes gene_type:complete
MKELPEKEKSTFIVGLWGDTWIASELQKIKKIKVGKFKDNDLVSFFKSEKYKNLKPKYSLLRVDGKVIPLENKPTQEIGSILSNAMGFGQYLEKRYKFISLNNKRVAILIL